MAAADYKSCDNCGRKTFYDSELDYGHRGDSPAPTGAGDWAVIRPECAKTMICMVRARKEHDPLFDAPQPGASKLTQANRDCIAKALPGEPMFVILGRDPDGATMVRLWAQRRKDAGDAAHADPVFAIADDMDAWRAAGHRPESAPPADAYAPAPQPGGAETKELRAVFEEIGDAIAQIEVQAVHVGSDAEARGAQKALGAVAQIRARLLAPPLGDAQEGGR